MGLADSSDKIPTKPQFTAKGGLYWELLMGTKKPVDPGGRAARGESLRGGRSGVVRVNAFVGGGDVIWCAGVFSICHMQMTWKHN